MLISIQDIGYSIHSRYVFFWRLVRLPPALRMDRGMTLLTNMSNEVSKRPYSSFDLSAVVTSSSNIVRRLDDDEFLMIYPLGSRAGAAAAKNNSGRAAAFLHGDRCGGRDRPRRCRKTENTMSGAEDLLQPPMRPCMPPGRQGGVLLDWQSTSMAKSKFSPALS